MASDEPEDTRRIDALAFVRRLAARLEAEGHPGMARDYWDGEWDGPFFVLYERDPDVDTVSFSDRMDRGAAAHARATAGFPPEEVEAAMELLVADLDEGRHRVTLAGGRVDVTTLAGD
jgi:hypothetical protein